MYNRSLKIDKAIFIISLDTELAWGTRGSKKYLEHYQETRKIIDRLLNLFNKYEIKATWAMVGHLFLDQCKKIDGVVHPEIIRPQYKWLHGDWFDVDPSSNLDSAPEWYGKDIVEKIINCLVKQEIGCHTFSHIDVKDNGCNRDCFTSELKKCRDLAQSFGLELKSFVFPKNKVANIDLLKEFGYLCFRDKDNNWYSNLPSSCKKIAHIIDEYLCLPTRSTTAKKLNEVWNFPGNYFYVHKNGWAKNLPICFRVKKVKIGINKAIKKNQIFHMWFHPFNLASDPDGLFQGLEEIFKYFISLKEKGLIDNMTMKEAAEYLNNKI
jgi:peptidoglycan/xylan/chitin deacetylase (PgdA/CDA1 family)